MPRKLLDATREVVKELFELPIEEKSKIYSLDLSKICMLYSSNVDYEREEIHNWRDPLRLVCTPLEECIHSWPEKPPEFR